MTRREKWTVGALLFLLGVSMACLWILLVGQGVILDGIEQQLAAQAKHAQAQIPGADCDTDIVCEYPDGTVTCGPCPVSEGKEL